MLPSIKRLNFYDQLFVVLRIDLHILVAIPQDFKRVDVVNLCQMLEKKRGGEDSGEKNESLKLIYRTFKKWSGDTKLPTRQWTSWMSCL
jgi:hypothetical protein